MTALTPLLATKLFAPAARSDAVPRPRLIERLDAGLGCRLTLLSAPAGFGKTSLLGAWAAARGRGVAWLSLDEGDDDPARFLAYLAAALQTAAPDIGLSAQSLLASPQPPPHRAVLTALINDLVDLGTAELDEAIVLILDDYHLLSAQPIHDSVTFLVDHLPPNLRLALAARADPPLPLARWRARGHLAEIHAADLRFTSDEAADFLNRVLGLGLAGSDVEALLSRTEGWIAALQLAAAAMWREEDPAGFIRSFTGSNRFILDYLSEEVFQRQPADLQEFLLQTSILDRLSGPLCDAVLGRADPPSALILEQLERANLFVTPLDDRREWFRYHRLFADLLRHHLRQSRPDRVPELHRRAAAWHEGQGDTARAIDHALAAGDVEHAAELVEGAAEATLKRGEFATGLRWLENLGLSSRLTRPQLGVFYTALLILAGRPAAEAEASLQAVERADSAGQFQGEVDIFRAMLAAYRGDTQTALGLARRAVERLPGASLLRGLAVRTLGTLCILIGDFAAAERLLEEDLASAERTGDIVGASASLRRLGTMYLLRGKLRAASRAYRRAIEVGTDEMGRPLPVAGRAWIRLGELIREWNELDEATRYLQEGIALVEDWAPTWALNGYLALARIRQAQRDFDGARRNMERARQLAIDFDVTDVDDFAVLAHRARLWIAQGDLDAASRWAAERGLARGAVRPRPGGELYAAMIGEMEDLTLARLHLAREQPAEALRLLDPLLPGAEEAGRGWTVIETLALQALAHQAHGDPFSAMRALERVLALAEPEGYVRIFLDEGAAMRALLAVYVSSAAGKAPADARLQVYSRRLLAEFDKEAAGRAPKTGPPPPAGLQPLIEPLSERELEVLRLLDAGLSTPEAAERLTVAVSTVRSHVKNIYGKLGVHRRLDALRRAGQLGLLR